MFLKVARAVAANLFAAEQSKDNRALRMRTFRQRFCQLEHRSYSGCIIVRAVENIVARHSFTNAEVIEMRRQQNRFFR